MASLFGNTVARCSSESQRSFAGVPSSPSSSRSTWPANRLPNCVIMLGFLVEGRRDAVGVLRHRGRRRVDVGPLASASRLLHIDSARTPRVAPTYLAWTPECPVPETRWPWEDLP